MKCGVLDATKFGQGRGCHSHSGGDNCFSLKRVPAKVCMAAWLNMASPRKPRQFRRISVGWLKFTLMKSNLLLVRQRGWGWDQSIVFTKSPPHTVNLVVGYDSKRGFIGTLCRPGNVERQRNIFHLWSDKVNKCEQIVSLCVPDCISQSSQDGKLEFMCPLTWQLAKSISVSDVLYQNHWSTAQWEDCRFHFFLRKYRDVEPPILPSVICRNLSPPPLYHVWLP